MKFTRGAWFVAVLGSMVLGVGVGYALRGAGPSPAAGGASRSRAGWAGGPAAPARRLHGAGRCAAFHGNRVLKETLQPGGTYTQSTVASGLHWPSGVAVDAHGNIYVADTVNNRVLKLCRTGR